MNYITFLIKSALFNFSRNKGRTFLTSLGILIGVMSVVLLTAAGLGLKKYIQTQFESIGTNTLRVIPGTAIRNGQFQGGPSSIGTIRFDEKDLRTLTRIRSLENVAPVFTKNGKASYGKETKFADIYATTSDIFPVLNFTPQYGKLFTRSDSIKSSKIAVIGPKLAENLYGNAKDAVGKNLKFENLNYRIVGVTQSKGGGGFGGPDLDSLIFVPYRSAFSFNPDKKFLTLAVKVKQGQSIPRVKKEITEALLRRYEEDDFSVFEPTEILSALNSIFGTLNIALVAIAAISLVVGGIGIMNIMYVTVTEKIKEIGIRRAIGARKTDILYQFLIESVILSLFGGLLGLILSFIIVFFLKFSKEYCSDSFLEFFLISRYFSFGNDSSFSISLRSDSGFNSLNRNPFTPDLTVSFNPPEE